MIVKRSLFQNIHTKRIQYPGRWMSYYREALNLTYEEAREMFTQYVKDGVLVFTKQVFYKEKI